MKGREISVGIFSAQEVKFVLLDDCIAEGGVFSGPQCASCRDGKVLFEGRLYEELLFSPLHPASEDEFQNPVFALDGVMIGVDFHWQRKERQTFAGSLRLIVENGLITAVNVISIEDYLRSVISSEMKATASLEFLKAHAVISRSWLLAQIERKKSCEKGRPDFVETDDRIVRWADREDHKRFDVCADDHCQRYQGLTRAELFAADAHSTVEKAVKDTRGQILSYRGAVCDARYYKCCGGITERFSSCWEERDYPYLTVVKDAPEGGGDAFCDTTDESILSQVLNDYDLETKDFFRWKVTYGRSELADLIRRRSGIDFGEKIISLDPVKRGPSGRIILMRITGSSRTMTIGKELTIRKWLSESHLKSSAFDVSYDGDIIVLEGRGWGHGVGLCQIGAAVMGARGYSYDEILEHYFPGAEITCIEK